MKYSISELLSILKAEGHTSGVNSKISYILTDSRSLSFPEDSLFFAIKTGKNDGHRYVEDLYVKGVRNFVVSDGSIKMHSDANYIIVEDTLQALQGLASYHRKRFECPVLAITGSNGKTIVKEWIWQLLKEDLRIDRSPRSYNSQIGVPLSAFQMDDKTELGIFEAGISQKGEMQKLEKIIKPDIGIFTNIGESHQENFASYEEKIDEKLLLFGSCEKIIYCRDQVLPAKMIEEKFPCEKLISWSCKDISANLYIKADGEGDNSRVEYSWNGIEGSLEFPFSDYLSLENAYSSLAFLLYMNLPAEEIAERVLKLEPVAMRLEVKSGKNGCVIINDSYNSDIYALSLALSFQSGRTGAEMGKTLILSDILQAGVKASDLYGAVAELVVKEKISHFIGVGKDIFENRSLFPDSSAFFITTQSLLASGYLDGIKNSCVLIKGSRSFGLENVSSYMSRKVHATIMEVDLNKLIGNVNYYRTYLKPETKMIAMVKAEAYGIGALEVAKTLQANSCYALAVAVPDEGVALRKGGISMPVYVMNPEFGSFSTMMEYHLEPEVYSFKLLKAFISEAETEGIKNYPVHIKLDTGMHRLGFEEDDLDELISVVKNQYALKISSVFSHLAGSDDIKFLEYTKKQLNLFEKMSCKIKKAFPKYYIMRHILNSAGIERFGEYQYDMVRLGIGLYGVSFYHPGRVEVVASLKTTILQLHNFKRGESIGYSRRWILQRDSVIATITIGYADGLDRHLGNGKGEVVIRGRRAPIVGNVCMDACMVDVTDIYGVTEGDTVTVFGEGMPLEEISSRLDTIPYEVLTSVSPRVKRVYFQE